MKAEYAINPIGIDAVAPRLSWNHGESGPQLAYQILAASSEELLKGGTADLWDSGRVEDSGHVLIPYGGPALVSGQRVYWKVRSWHPNDRIEDSNVAWFEMGLLKKDDWHGKFLSVPCVGGGGRGYQSQSFGPGQIGEYWAQIDLGREQSFDRFVLHPVWCPELGAAVGNGWGFPVRWRIEGSDDAGFEAAEILYETPADVPHPGLAPYEVRLSAPATSRFVRLTVVKPFSVPDLPPVSGGKGSTLFALDELEIFSGETNIALRCPASAPNASRAQIAVGSYDWHIDCLTDGDIHIPVVRRDKGKNNLLRKVVQLYKPVARARAYVASRGWHELRLNGEKVGDAVLDSAWTDFAKRLLYSTWDVTSLLNVGANVVTIMVGNGWTLDPAVILQLNIEHPDGSTTTVCSDDQWRAVPGPVRENHVFHGELFDTAFDDPAVFTVDFDDSSFPLADTLTDYQPILSSQMLPPIRVTETVKPISMTQPQPGVWIFDMGTNRAGWAQLRGRFNGRHEIKMRFAELIWDDGTLWTDPEQTEARRAGTLDVVDGMLNTSNLRVARVCDRYLCKGDGSEEIWEPRFTYRGFRFVELTGFPGTPDLNTITARRAHTGVADISSFDCSDPVLNWAYEAARGSFQSNLYSLFTDCCARDERQPWGGDSHTTCDAMLSSLDIASSYDKWLQDSRDSQRDDGATADTVPYSLGRQGGDIAWGCTWALIAWQLYLHTGDARILQKHFDSIQRYLDFLDRTYPDYFPDNANYGEWLALEKAPNALVEIVHWAETAQIAARSAAVLGLEQEHQHWKGVAGKLAAIFHQRFYNAEKGWYADGCQGAQAMPLRFGLVPESVRETVFQRLVENVESHGRHLTTGMIATRALLQVLSDFGRPDLAFAVASTKDFPGWGFMMAHEATSMWEHWQQRTGTAMNSHNHSTYGSIVGWLIKGLAGIQPVPEAPGFRKIRFAPGFPEGLDNAKGELKTLWGLVRSAWVRHGESIRLELEIPPDCSALLKLPKGCVVYQDDQNALLPSNSSGGEYEVKSGKEIILQLTPLK